MTQKKVKDTKHNKHNNKGYIKIVFIIVLIFISFLIIKNKSIKHNYEITQIVLNNENITEKLQNTMIFENNEIYMSYDDVKTLLDKTLYTEENTDLIITTSDRKLAVINTENQALKINGSNVEAKDIIIKKDEIIYIAISELKSVYNYEIEKIDKTNTITIDSLDKKCVKAYVKKNIKVKREKNIMSSNVDKVKKGTWLYFINSEDGYAKVRTQNGIIGFVKEKSLNSFINERDDFLIESKSFREEYSIKKDISKEDISSFEKRQNIINLILQEAVKNDKMYVQISYNGEENANYERFKIEIVPILKECGIETKM